MLAVAGMNRDQEMAAIEELMRLHRMPLPDRIGEVINRKAALQSA